MLRMIGLIGLALLLASPASAIPYKDKLNTCKFGATAEKLTGAKRNAFIKKCMGKGDYEPPGRTVSKAKTTAKKMTTAKKKTTAMKKPAAKPAAIVVPEPKPQ